MKKLLLLTALLYGCAVPRYEMVAVDYHYLVKKVVMKDQPYFVFRDGSALAVDIELYIKTPINSIVKVERRRKVN